MNKNGSVIKYGKAAVSLCTVLLCVASALIGAGLLLACIACLIQPQPWTDDDHLYFPWALGLVSES
jgi:hypothetical protein